MYVSLNMKSAVYEQAMHYKSRGQEAHLEERPNLQLLKNFPAFCGTRRSITVFTRALHWSLS
jgi:hypothetical protein